SDLPATESSAASIRCSAIRFNFRQEPFRWGFAQTRPSQAVSCHGTRIEMCRRAEEGIIVVHVYGTLNGENHNLPVGPAQSLGQIIARDLCVSLKLAFT